MTDAEFEAEHDRIDSLIKFWQDALRLWDYRINVDYHRVRPDSLNSDFVADVETRWEYQTATIRFNMPAVIGLSDDDLCICVAHEFMHILLRPLKPDPQEHWHHNLEELTCERLARALTVLKKADNDAA